jgi:hypothetical protein
MKKYIFLIVLPVCLALFNQGSLNATNYAMSLPGGDGTTISGALSNIDISGVPLNSLPYTMEMWIKIAEKQVQYAGLIYHRYDASINSGVQFAASWQMGATPNAIRINNNTTGYGLISDTVTLNNWHHIAIVVTESSRTCYVDGHKTTQNVTIPVYDFSGGRMWIGRDSANATNDNRAFKGLIDEVRIWNVARTEKELTDNKYLTLTGSEPGLVGYWNFNDSASVATDLSSSANHGIITGGKYVRATPTELMTALGNLSLGDISQVTENLTLPKTAAGGVTISWTSSNPAVVDTFGVIHRPQSYDATVKLTATLYQTQNGVTYTFTKSFTVVVKSLFEASLQVADWNFAAENISLQNGSIKVKDASENAFSATLMNEASIRTIGSTEKFNVLDLGNGKGYLDMGTDIGKAIYSLNNYTICGYFRVDDDYANLNNAGNIYWTFSNTADASNIKTGYMIGSLKSQSLSITNANNTIGNQSVGIDSNAVLGSWHHIAYTQNGEVGTIYIDGIQRATGPVSNLPSLTLPQTGITGTLYNWLGRSPYTSDSYLNKTLLYDFQIWRDAMSSDDLLFDMGVPGTVEKLNNAYNENSSYILPELATERDALTLGNISALTSNLTLPSKGSIDKTISILWKSNRTDIISASGVVTRPDYFPMNVTLTATLFKNGQTVTKDFIATVTEKAGTSFTGDLLLKYDFSNVSDTVVTDMAEKHFKGVLKNDATIRTIGESVKYKVLDLGDSIGYFNMGTEAGKLMYHLNNYTISTYYRVDTSYHALGTAGNFLYTFSNSANSGTDQNGYLFAGLNAQSYIITPGYWSAASGQQGISVGTAPITGTWHNMTFVQKADTGYLYVDGVVVASDTITNKPSTALPKDNRTGTLYNWIGRSNYTGDAYLRNTLVYDFRLYKTALNDEQIQTTVLNVGATINALENAYMENPNNSVSVKSAENKSIKIYSTANGIRINGLTGKEKVSLFDISGRRIHITDPSEIIINRGIYLVKVDNNVSKVFVR